MPETEQCICGHGKFCHEFPKAFSSEARCVIPGGCPCVEWRPVEQPASTVVQDTKGD